MNVPFRVLIITSVFFIIGGAVWITIFDQGVSKTRIGAVSQEGNGKSPQVGIPVLNESEEKGHGSGYANGLSIKIPTNESSVNIFAAGDIAKCDGEDALVEELQELVGLLPENSGKDKNEVEEQPFYEEFLEFLGLQEETDHYASAEETAALLHGLKGRILALGDLGYPIGSPQAFNECYNRTWGPLKDRTYPVAGNHEYKTEEAVPYFAYWGRQAGEAGKGYYSFDHGGWHMIALNSKLEKKEHRNTISPQHAWLKGDLAATNARCILAYWHHPVFSSGQQAGSPRMKNMLRTLYNSGVTVVLTAHAHNYERFALQNPEGGLDSSRGFREFVVGTGGAPLRPLATRQPNSEVFRADTFGVLQLELFPDRYRWAFLPVGGEAPFDSGSGSCVPPRRN